MTSPSPVSRRVRLWSATGALMAAALVFASAAQAGPPGAPGPGGPPPGPTPVASPVSTVKKGIASAGLIWTAPAKVAALKVGWAYDWTFLKPPSMGSVEFVPMLWGTREVTAANVAYLTRGKQAKEFTTLLGFNEPDNPYQGNMSVAEAIALWPSLMSTGLRLGSPGAANAYGTWLDRFMAQAKKRGYRVDFLTIHLYPDWTHPNAVAQARAQLQRIYKTYKLPIWVTEVGTLDLGYMGYRMNATKTQARAVAFQRQLTTMLNALPYVERYSWSTDDCATLTWCAPTSLYSARGALTSLGASYASTVSAAIP